MRGSLIFIQTFGRISIISSTCIIGAGYLKEVRSKFPEPGTVQYGVGVW